MSVYLDTARRVIQTEADGLRRLEASLSDVLGDGFDRADGQGRRKRVTEGKSLKSA